MTIDRRVTRTRTALYDALVTLIRAKPYDGITVEDILTQANVGRSTFYSHFTSKDDLLERSLERLHALLTRALADRDGPWDPCRALFEHVAEYRDVQLTLATGRGGAVLREAVDAVLARFLRPIVVADQPDAPPRELITRHIISTYHTVAGWWFTERPVMKAAEADALFRRLLLQALPPDACGAFLSRP